MGAETCTMLHLSIPCQRRVPSRERGVSVSPPAGQQSDITALKHVAAPNCASRLSAYSRMHNHDYIEHNETLM